MLLLGLVDLRVAEVIVVVEGHLFGFFTREPSFVVGEHLHSSRELVVCQITFLELLFDVHFELTQLVLYLLIHVQVAQVVFVEETLTLRFPLLRTTLMLTSV